MRSDPNLLLRFPSSPSCPISGWFGLRVRIHIEPDLLEGLGDPSNHRGGFVVCELLSKTNPWACVEWEEDEGVRDEVLFNPIIQESVWVKFVGWGDVIVSGGWVSDMSMLTGLPPQIRSAMHQPRRIVDLGIRGDVYRFSPIHRGPKDPPLRTPKIQGSTFRSVRLHRHTAGSMNSHVRVQTQCF